MRDSPEPKHGVPASTITEIADRCLQANHHGHAVYVYLTDLEDECDFQGTVHLVGYAEPADALPEHYHHVKTVMENASLTWWYEQLLEDVLEREWPLALARGLVTDTHQTARKAKPPTKTNITQVAREVRDHQEPAKHGPNVCYTIQNGRIVLQTSPTRPEPGSDTKLLFVNHRSYRNGVTKHGDDIYRELWAMGVYHQ